MDFQQTYVFGSIPWIYTDATETTKNMVEVTQVFLSYTGYLLPVDGSVILWNGCFHYPPSFTGIQVLLPSHLESFILDLSIVDLTTNAVDMINHIGLFT